MIRAANYFAIMYCKCGHRSEAPSFNMALAYYALHRSKECKA